MSTNYCYIFPFQWRAEKKQKELTELKILGPSNVSVPKSAGGVKKWSLEDDADDEEEGGKKEAEGEEEEDPLDAYMAGIQQEVRQELSRFSGISFLTG